MRVWEPTSRFVGNTNVPREVKRWTWTRPGGLRVEYLCGLKCRSDWKTLPAFLKAVAEGREGPVREVTA